MKKVILIFLSFIVINQLYGQKLFYQYEGVLVKDGVKVKVNFHDSLYNIDDGIVSPKGNYACGYILKGALKERIESVKKASGIIDFFDEGEKIFVIYSFKDKNVIYVDTLEYGPEVLFSGNDKYVLLSIDYIEDETSKLFNLEKGKIEYEFPEGYQDFKWFKNKLYFLFDGGPKYIFCRYNMEEKKTEDIYFIQREKTYKKFDDYSFEIIDSLRVLFRYKTEEGTWLKLIEKNKTITLFGAEYINIDYMYDDNILFSADRGNDGQSYILYSLNLEDYVINRLFSWRDLDLKVPKDWLIDGVTMGGYSRPFKLKNDIYFFSGAAFYGTDRRFMKYNISSKKFSMVTEKGHISAPIGYFEE